MEKILRVRVTPFNSTVNGRPAQELADARLNWAGWKNLGLADDRVRTDGRANEDMGVYLHVPVLGDDEDRWYRVRSAIEVGGNFNGKKVLEVKAERKGKRWYWVFLVGRRTR